MVTCIISVVVASSGISFEVSTPLEGKILKENEVYIIGDFSAKAKEANYRGDYSSVVVKKEKCFK